MPIPVVLTSLSVAEVKLELFVPDASVVQDLYRENVEAAYWSKIWPASIALCHFLHHHPHYIANKHVLELAAGLGLPGLYAALIADKVSITDINTEAVNCIEQSIKYLELSNADSCVLNWNDAINGQLPDVVMMSDVNYELAVFEELKKILFSLLQKNVSIIISTPQRLVAKPFISDLLDNCFCSFQWHDEIVLDGETTGVSVFVLSGMFE